MSTTALTIGPSRIPATPDGSSTNWVELAGAGRALTAERAQAPDLVEGVSAPVDERPPFFCGR